MTLLAIPGIGETGTTNRLLPAMALPGTWESHCGEEPVCGACFANPRNRQQRHSWKVHPSGYRSHQKAEKENNLFPCFITLVPKGTNQCTALEQCTGSWRDEPVQVPPVVEHRVFAIQSAFPDVSGKSRGQVVPLFSDRKSVAPWKHVFPRVHADETRK